MSKRPDPAPTGTYTIQDLNGRFATAPLIIKQAVEFKDPTGAQNQKWLISTVVGISTIKSVSLGAYAWVVEPSEAGSAVSANATERKWITGVADNQGTIKTASGTPLFWALDGNLKAILAGGGDQFIFTEVSN